MTQDTKKFTQDFKYVRLIRQADYSLEMYSAPIEEIVQCAGSAEIALNEFKSIRLFLQDMENMMQEQFDENVFQHLNELMQDVDGAVQDIESALKAKA